MNANFRLVSVLLMSIPQLLNGWENDVVLPLKPQNNLLFYEIGSVPFGALNEILAWRPEILCAASGWNVVASFTRAGQYMGKVHP